MTDAEADAFALELEAELESQQQAAEPPSQAVASASGSAPEPLSEYELERLQNIARNQQVLAGLGLEGLGLPPAGPSRAAPARDPYPPGRSGAAPTRRSDIVRPTRNYTEQGEDEHLRGARAPEPEPEQAPVRRPRASA